MILTIIAGFVLAYGLWWLAQQNIGYVDVNVLDWQFRAPIHLVLVATALAFIALYILVRVLGSVWRVPKQVRQWSDQQSVNRAHQQTARGYTALIEGDYEKAERKLTTNAEKHSTPVLNYIAAANAAQQRQDYVQRDRYLRLALEADPEGRRAIGLTKARLQYEAGQLEKAQATLHALRAVAPDNPKIVRLLVEIQRELGDWDGLHLTLPHSRSVAAHDATELAQLEREAHQQSLAAPANVDEAPAVELESRWKQLKPKQRKDTALVRTFVEQMIANNELDRAEKELRVTLKREWDSDLAYLYGQTITSRVDEQLELAKEWEKQHPDDPDLLLTLGRLASECRQWDDARYYLQSAVEHGGRDEARAELGALLEDMGETTDALAVYRDGISKLTGSVKKVGLLPAPHSDAYSNESK